MKLNGKPLDLRSLAHTKDDLLRWLDTAPADEIFSGAELEKHGYSRYKEWVSAATAGYTVKIGHLRYWGNPKAIKELQNQLKASR